MVTLLTHKGFKLMLLSSLAINAKTSNFARQGGVKLPEKIVITNSLFSIMHDIEPFSNWRDHYIAAEDERSPFYGREYDEFGYTHQVYNYFIHPQWDEFGSNTLYLKILFADYDEGYAIMELIGEWNDCIDNDIMFLKRKVMDHLIDEGISRFILICENVLNFHGSDDEYYMEWQEDVCENEGWVSLLNAFPHVHDEMYETRLHHCINFGDAYNDINWRPMKPAILYQVVNRLVEENSRRFISD